MRFSVRSEVETRARGFPFFLSCLRACVYVFLCVIRLK